MAKDLMDLFDELNAVGDQNEKKLTREEIIRAPFGYPGGKSRAVDYIIPKLPYRDGYCEPFGGSASVMLARKPSALEIYNDRYGGVVSFYRCMRDEKMLGELMMRLDHTIHSREEFLWCKETWENCKDDVERAARWYYLNQCSFGCIGRNFGRTTTPARNHMAGKIQAALPDFYRIHARFKKITVENLDWRTCLKDYDHDSMVFYIDPPYVPETTTDNNLYRDRTMDRKDHIDLLEAIMRAKAFCALSSYENELYDSYKWDDTITWGQYVSMGGGANDEKWRFENRKNTREKLYIKYN